VVEVRESSGSRRAAIAWAALALILAFAGQFLTVHFNYGGNWTGLFCTGSHFPVPPELSGEHIYIFSNSAGYDGQFYHYIAHDPFFQRGFASYIDAPRLRYRRILVPFLAWLLSGGGGRYLHAAYIGVNLAFVFLGSYWLGRCFQLRGMHPAWGLAFLGIPGVLISLDRMVVDGPLTALAAGFVWHTLAGPATALLAVLVAAPLVRETGVLLTAAAVLAALAERRWRRAILYGATALPALAWFAFVQSHTTPAGGGPRLLTWPFVGLYQRIFTPSAYRLPVHISLLAATLDWVAIAGVLLTVALTLRLVTRRRNALAAAVALYAILLTTLRVHFWLDAYSYTRLISPLFVLLLAPDWGLPLRWPVAAIGLMLLRNVMQLGWQALGIVRRLVG
jgi:hypothetical protein